MALCLPALARLLWRGLQPRWPWWQQAGVHFGMGCVVLVLGLVLLGRDGAMLSYAALVGLSAVLQWVMMRRH